MKRLLGVLVVMLLVITGCSKQESKEKVRIGIIQWAEHPALDAAREGLVQELKTLGVDATIDVKNANDDASAANLIVNKFVEEKVDLIYAIATPAAQAALNVTEGTNIPVVFNAVTDAVDAGLVASNEKPGGMVTGVSDMAPIDRQIALIKEVLPNAKNIGVLYNTGEANSINQVAEVESKVKAHGLELVKQGITSPQDIAIASEQLVSKTDALYIITDNMVAKAAPQVVDFANKGKIPVFMAESGQFEHGILASDSISYLGLGQQAARIVKRILIDGEKPGDIPVEISTTTELLVSQKVADLLGIELPASVLERAIVK